MREEGTSNILKEPRREDPQRRRVPFLPPSGRADINWRHRISKFRERNQRGGSVDLRHIELNYTELS